MGSLLQYLFTLSEIISGKSEFHTLRESKNHLCSGRMLPGKGSVPWSQSSGEGQCMSHLELLSQADFKISQIFKNQLVNDFTSL